MSRVLIYLDESGDLGWKFTAPYRSGGSSRYLTIASLLISPEKKHLPKRVIKRLYDKFHWPTAIEKKWSDMTFDERVAFAQGAKQLIATNHSDIQYASITVKKENVQEHIRSDSNKLYNYMIGLSLTDNMGKFDQVSFFPDPRSVKVESGNSLHDYLQTKLWFDLSVKTNLETTPLESSASRNIQFADMLAGLVQNHFEDGNSDPWRTIGSKIECKRLYF